MVTIGYINEEADGTNSAPEVDIEMRSASIDNTIINKSIDDTANEADDGNETSKAEIDHVLNQSRLTSAGFNDKADSATTKSLKADSETASTLIVCNKKNHNNDDEVDDCKHSSKTDSELLHCDEADDVNTTFEAESKIRNFDKAESAYIAHEAESDYNHDINEADSDKNTLEAELNTDNNDEADSVMFVLEAKSKLRYNDDEADSTNTAPKAKSNVNNNYDEADSCNEALEAESKLCNKPISNKVVSLLDKSNYNYSLLYNFHKLEKNEIPSSPEYHINYVGPILCEDIAKENERFNYCVEDTCEYVMDMFNEEYKYYLKSTSKEIPDSKHLNIDLIKKYLTLLRTNFLFDIGFKVRNTHKLMKTDGKGLRLCRCPCSMDNWMRKIIHPAMLVNESDECQSTITWFTPIGLMKHLSSTFNNDERDCNHQPWLHQITYYFLWVYYRNFFPSPWIDNSPLGNHHIHVIEEKESHLKKGFIEDSKHTMNINLSSICSPSFEISILIYQK
jgi:hypothetical protein